MGLHDNIWHYFMNAWPNGHCDWHELLNVYVPGLLFVWVWKSRKCTFSLRVSNEFQSRNGAFPIWWSLFVSFCISKFLGVLYLKLNNRAKYEYCPWTIFKVIISIPFPWKWNQFPWMGTISFTCQPISKIFRRLSFRIKCNGFNFTNPS